MTEGDDDIEYKAIVKKGILTAYIILTIFTLMGDLIFKFYGITIYAFMIAGGILFLRNSFDMIDSKDSKK